MTIAPGSFTVKNYVALWTLVKREMKRMWVVINQVVWPPVITTVLYVTVFGLALGSRIGTTQGVPYGAFLIPGLIMLQVINESYGEASSSVFQGRFLNHVQEMLISPMSALEIVLGFVIAGVVRAFIIAGLITILGMLLVHVGPHNLGLYLLVVTIVAILFSSIGIIFGLMAEKFDHIAIFTTFVITPLVFVGGVFTSSRFLPPAVQKLSLFNPMFYMIDAFRYSFTGRSDIELGLSLLVVLVLSGAAFGTALYDDGGWIQTPNVNPWGLDMKITRFFAALAFGVAAALPASAAEAPATAPALVQGDPAPAFDLPTIDGKRVTLDSLHGKTVIINVWATWCPPCQEETANLIKAYNQSAGNDVVFIGVDSTETAPLVKAFAAAKDIKFLETVDTDQTFAKAYRVKYFPTTYVIGPDGVLRMVYIDLVTPKLIAQFVADAQANRNSQLTSPIQEKIDALLAPSKYAFAGDAAHVDATVAGFQKAVGQVGEMIDNSDPVAGNPIDVPRTEAEENSLRAEAIVAMKPIATTRARKIAFDLLQGDASEYEGKHEEALTAYTAAHALDPKNEDALGGMATAAGRLKNYDVVIRADEQLIALEPKSVPGLRRSRRDLWYSQTLRGRPARVRSCGSQSRQQRPMHRTRRQPTFGCWRGRISTTVVWKPKPETSRRRVSNSRMPRKRRCGFRRRTRGTRSISSKRRKKRSRSTFAARRARQPRSHLRRGRGRNCPVARRIPQSTGSSSPESRGRAFVCTRSIFRRVGSPRSAQIASARRYKSRRRYPTQA